ncbi:hypothetical protein [Hyalangium sp.]|uniref:hypothetical protein n=1 Tax=Hyalangium sp. TaxID=2028555 RepID=UPI002D2D74CB|nr:hypothetical protein [Hyalangium sp.]HYI01671.1 hypothetical protein [Hyalangium sp.]
MGRLATRLQQMTQELEEMVPELKDVLAEAKTQASPVAGGVSLLVTPARGLERAARAIKTLVGGDEAGPHAYRSLLQSPVMPVPGSRVVLSGVRGGSPATPSIGARALAVLLESPESTFDAAEMGARLGCSQAVARTTLHRLVRSGHAARQETGRFRAKSRR